jgi:hypothetical protein
MRRAAGRVCAQTGRNAHAVPRTAAALHERADELELPHKLKTTGSIRLKVLFPVQRTLGREQARGWRNPGEAHREPRQAIASLEGTAQARRRKGHLDLLQNGHRKLLVAPCSGPIRIGNDEQRMGLLGHDAMQPMLADTPDTPRSLAKQQALVR